MFQKFLKKPIYLAIFIWLLFAWIVFSLYANYDEKLTSNKSEKEKILETEVILNSSLDNSSEEKINKNSEDKVKESTNIIDTQEEKKEKTTMKQVQFTSKQNKRFLNLTKKARDELKEKWIDLFIKLPKNYFHCNKFWCYLNYEEVSKNNKKHFVVKRINSITWEKQTTVYIISYNIKDKGYDISKRLKYTTIQDRSLSCESSSAADIVSYLTASRVWETEIVEQIKNQWIWYNKLPIEDENTWRKYWWNPDVWFVWYIDDYEEEREISEENIEEINFESDLSGIDDLELFEENKIVEIKTEIVKVKARQYSLNWYWVHEKPFLPIYESYWLNAEIINKYDYKKLWLNSKSHLKKLLLELKKWNMVQLWWDYCTLEKYEDWIIAESEVRRKEKIIESMQWNAKNTCSNTSSSRDLKWYIKEDWKDKLFTWLSWQHNFYLLWYTWDINRPSWIIVWDTYTWKHTYSPIEWYRKWSKMQNRSIIVSKK